MFFGDSITDGWRLNAYFPGKPYVNRGIGGQITGEMLGRMKADVIDLKSAAVLILAGMTLPAASLSLDREHAAQDVLGTCCDRAGEANRKPMAEYACRILTDDREHSKGR